MNAWESLVAAGKANDAWNSHPRAGSVTVLGGRPVQIGGRVHVKNPVKGRSGWNVVTFRYLDGATEIGQMPAGQFNLATRREYRRLSKIAALVSP